MPALNVHQAQPKDAPWGCFIYSQRFGQVLINKALDEHHQPIVEVKYQSAQGFFIALQVMFSGNWRTQKQRQGTFFDAVSVPLIEALILNNQAARPNNFAERHHPQLPHIH